MQRIEFDVCHNEEERQVLTPDNYYVTRVLSLVRVAKDVPSGGRKERKPQLPIVDFSSFSSSSVNADWEIFKFPKNVEKSKAIVTTRKTIKGSFKAISAPSGNVFKAVEEVWKKFDKFDKVATDQGKYTVLLNDLLQNQFRRGIQVEMKVIEEHESTRKFESEFTNGEFKFVFHIIPDSQSSEDAKEIGSRLFLDVVFPGSSKRFENLIREMTLMTAPRKHTSRKNHPMEFIVDPEDVLAEEMKNDAKEAILKKKEEEKGKLDASFQEQLEIVRDSGDMDSKDQQLLDSSYSEQFKEVKDTIVFDPELLGQFQMEFEGKIPLLNHEEGRAKFAEMKKLLKSNPSYELKMTTKKEETKVELLSSKRRVMCLISRDTEWAYHNLLNTLAAHAQKK